MTEKICRIPYVKPLSIVPPRKRNGIPINLVDYLLYEFIETPNKPEKRISFEYEARDRMNDNQLTKHNKDIYSIDGVDYYKTGMTVDEAIEILSTIPLVNSLTDYKNRDIHQEINSVLSMLGLPTFKMLNRGEICEDLPPHRLIQDEELGEALKKEMEKYIKQSQARFCKIHDGIIYTRAVAPEISLGNVNSDDYHKDTGTRHAMGIKFHIRHIDKDEKISKSGKEQTYPLEYLGTLAEKLNELDNNTIYAGIDEWNRTTSQNVEITIIKPDITQLLDVDKIKEFLESINKPEDSWNLDRQSSKMLMAYIPIVQAWEYIDENGITMEGIDNLVQAYKAYNHVIESAEKKPFLHMDSIIRKVTRLENYIQDAQIIQSQINDDTLINHMKAVMDGETTFDIKEPEHGHHSIPTIR